MLADSSAPVWPPVLPRRRAVVLAGLGGAVAALGLAPFDLWFLSILGFAGLYALFLTADGWRRAALLGWAGGAGYFLLALNWIVEPFLVDIARHGWMAPFALVLMAGGLALFWALGFGLARAVAGPRALAWVLALVLAEILRSYIFTGFPWALPGHVLITAPAVHLAAILGAHGLGLLVLGTAAALVHLATPARGPALAMLALAVAVSVWGLMRPEAGAGEGAPIVRLIQPNAPQHEKWDPDKAPVFFRRQVSFTAIPGDDPARRPDLIVWPETAVPLWLDYADEALGVIAEAAAGSPVVLGIQREVGRRIYNTAIRLYAGGTVGALYDKHHLVPFGEYMPLGDWLAEFGIHGLAANEGQGYSPGPGAALMDLPGIGPALPLICYEAVFPNDVRAAPARPRLLLQITNDAWFGQASGPYQHLAQARLRAVEFGLPMVRVANTGVSAMIDARGKVQAQIALGQAGWVDAALPPALPVTPYARMGDAPLAALIALILALLGLIHAMRRGVKPD